MRYWPDAFVATDRTFSISAGLDASTLTPGSTAPDVSRTTPVIEACAYASEGMIRSTTEAHAIFARDMEPPEVTRVYGGSLRGRIIAQEASHLDGRTAYSIVLAELEVWYRYGVQEKEFSRHGGRRKR